MGALVSTWGKKKRRTNTLACQVLFAVARHWVGNLPAQRLSVLCVCMLSNTAGN